MGWSIFVFVGTPRQTMYSQATRKLNGNCTVSMKWVLVLRQKVSLGVTWHSLNGYKWEDK